MTASEVEFGECYRALAGTPLTDNIDEEEFIHICEVHDAHLKHCQAGDKILTVDSPKDAVVVVVTGRIYAIQEDFNGKRFIIKTAEAGEALSFTVSKIKNDNLSYSAEAVAKDTKVLLLNLKHLLEPWPTKDPEVAFLKNLMLFMLSAHHTTYQHLIDLSKRSTREKLIAYLLNTALVQQSNDVTIHLSRQELADYLCVDRSAMSTELGKLKKAGFMDYSGNHFILHDMSKYL